MLFWYFFFKPVLFTKNKYVSLLLVFSKREILIIYGIIKWNDFRPNKKRSQMFRFKFMRSCELKFSLFGPLVTGTYYYYWL